MNDEFEKRLNQIELNEPPPNLRAEVLQSIPTASGATERATPNIPWWKEFFWPCPQAWLGMAASWLLMLGLQYSTPEFTPNAGSTTAAETSARDLHRQWYPDEYALLESTETATEEDDPPETQGPRSHMRRHELDYA